MTSHSPRVGLLHRLRHPKTTVRWRLTLLYAGLFLVSGAALLAITYTLVAHATFDYQTAFRSAIAQQRAPGSNARTSQGFTTVPPIWLRQHSPATVGPPPTVQKLLNSRTGRKAILIAGSQQRVADLHHLIFESSIALAIMALVSGALGWLVAGRVLRPLRTMTTATQHISAANLNERLSMGGPPDELRKLADTIDELLERLEGAFDAQRRFVANASHELRTPLTAARALLEMVLTDPHATIETFRTTCRQVLEEGEQQEELIDALLALARGQRGLGRREPLNLATIAGEVLDRYRDGALAHGLQLESTLDSAPMSGDRRLVGRMVSNLVENAIRHNIEHGRVRVWVENDSGEATFAITNTGPMIPADDVDRLLQPFQRRARERVGQGDGFGLGLSIVAAIAQAHDAALDVRPGMDGGLRVEVRFPRARETEALTPPSDDPRLLEPAAGQLALPPAGAAAVARR